MKPRRIASAAQRGMTLIELMVALLISTLMVLAVVVVMSTFEGRRRTLGSGADLDQSGAIAMYQIDQWVRSAGSGLAQGYNATAGGIGPYAYGCPIYAANASTQILPATASLAAPFGGVSVTAAAPLTFRLAPVLVLPNQTTPGASGKPSDVLVTMSSGTNLGQVPSLFSAAATSSQLSLVNVMAFSPSDLVLLVDQQGVAGGNLAPCLVTQVSSTFTRPSASVTPVPTTLPLGGTGASWYSSTVGSVAVSNFSLSGVAMDLGNPLAGTTSEPAGGTGGSAPMFQLAGVGDNDTLFTYDLLNIAGTASQPRAQDVFEMHVLYGVQSVPGSTAGCIVSNWVNPATDTTYTVSALMAGTPAAASLIKSICALRVGLILRTELPEKAAVKEATSLTLFANFPPAAPNSALVYPRPLSLAEQIYRYRTIEATIPVRNNNF